MPGYGDIHEHTEDSSGGNGRDTNGKAQAVLHKEKPIVQNSWEAVTKTVDRFDDDLAQGYKEDIDTLLVFAGLFSAVVTAFTIESYQWLQEDPADTTAILLNSTVVLLTQIAQQSGNIQTPLPSPPTHFTPSSSVVRINTFWFLSLTLALVDALFGLLCKQWLRERQRQTNTHTPGQALTLRWLRHRSFEEWHVPKILASLPILLEIALFLFFAGLLELLWTRHPVPFSIALAAAGLAVLFYLTTTILPGVTIIRQTLQSRPGFFFELHPSKIRFFPKLDLICPYKSSQSWLTFRLVSVVYRLPHYKMLLYSFVVKLIPSLTQCLPADTVTDILSLSDWPLLDLSVIQRFSSVKGCPEFYELMGLRWLMQEIRDTPPMIPHLKNVLAELPIHLVMPAIFGWWGSPVAFDFDYALENHHRDTDDLFDDQLSAHDLTLACQTLAFRHLLVTFDRDDQSGCLAHEVEDFWLKEPRNGRLTQSLFCPEQLLLGPSTASGYIKILDFYGRHWDKVEALTQVELVVRLSITILSSIKSSMEHEIRTTVLGSSHGLEFLDLVNNNVCEQEEVSKRNNCVTPWMDVLRHVRHIHQLPPLHFQPIPGYFPIPTDELQDLLDDSSTSDSVLGPLLDSHKQCWDNVKLSYQKEELVIILTSHINNRVPVPVPTGSDSTSTQVLPRSSSFLVESQQGLGFLTFVNDKLVEDESWSGEVIRPWVDALGYIQVLRGLPSGYFKPVPKHDDRSGEIVGWYASWSKRGVVNSEGEPGGAEANHSRNEYGPPSPSYSAERPGSGSGESEKKKLVMCDEKAKEPDNEGISRVKEETDNEVIAHSVIVDEGGVGGLGADNNV